MMTMSSLLVLLTISLPLLTLQASALSENEDRLGGWKKRLVLKALRALNKQRCLDCPDEVVSRTADADPSILKKALLPLAKKDGQGIVLGGSNMNWDFDSATTSGPAQADIDSFAQEIEDFVNLLNEQEIY